LSFAFLVAPSLALTKKQLENVAQAVRKLTKVEGPNPGQTFEQFYQGLSVNGKRGFAVLMRSGSKRPGVQRAEAVMARLRRLESDVFAGHPTLDGKTLESFLDDVGELDIHIRSLGSESQDEFEVVLRSIAPKVSRGADAGKSMKSVKGAVGEIVESLHVHKAGGQLDKFQPRFQGRLFREGLYSGTYKTISGPFYLEVKNWEFFAKNSPRRARKAMGDQVHSHFRRLSENGMLPSKNVSSWDGLVFRFSAPAKGTKEYKELSATIRVATAFRVRNILKKKFGVEDEAELRGLVKEFMENRLLIESA